tara:strand:+ start:342 stop:716 length:375 start_codon:yes stop_codon:yes gene_type:complete
MEKYLYFRATATLADDDDAANGSNTYPLSSFLGMESVGDSTFEMFFKQKHNSFSSHDDAVFGVNDSVVITITTANNQKAVMQELVKIFANSKDEFIVVADDYSSEYAHSDIASVGAFTVTADHA